MLTLLNRHVYRAGRKTFHSSFRAAPLAYTGRMLHPEPPTSRTITQPFSVNADQNAHFIGKRPQEENPLDVSPCAHNISMNSEEDWVGTMGIEDGIMESIAAEIGISYLSKVAMAEAKRVVSKCVGCIPGARKPPIYPFAVSYREEARWVYFVIPSGSQYTYLSSEVSALLVKKAGILINIG